MATKTTQKTETELLIQALAKKHFDVWTLETRNHDNDDFHTVAVWDIKSALEAAFEAGQKAAAAGQKKSTKKGAR